MPSGQHQRAVLASLFLLIFSAGFAQAVSPQLNSVIPRGGQRGTEVAVVLNGQRLEDAQEIFFYQPGITAKDLTVASPTQVKATFVIAPECQLGTVRLRIRTATGISELRTFRISALPTVAEKEPNNEFTKPQVIDQNVTVEGIITNEDIDYFQIEAKKGDRISVEVDGIRLGDTMFDPFVSILNDDRFELANSDDIAIAYQDCAASVIAPEDGKYIIQVRESAYGGSGNSHYRCHIGTFPRPVGVVPAGGKPGTTVPVRFLGAKGPEITREIALPAVADPDYQVFAEDAGGISPSGFLFRLNDLESVVEIESNNTRESATRFPAPGAINGHIADKDDADYFVFTGKKGQTVDINVFARRLRSELDSVLTVHAADGRVLGSNDDTGGPDSYFRFSIPADGDYYLNVRDHLGRGGDSFFYRVEVTPVVPAVDVAINEFVQYIEPRLAIPQGNRIALLLGVTRRNMGGVIDFVGENLPQGVSVESVQLLADLNVAQIILKADTDAPVAGRLSQIVANTVDPNLPAPVRSETTQHAVLVRGQNNNPFWTEPLHALAISVTNAAPFSLAIVEPKVPLVQNGVMKLKVVATRAEDFIAPIKIELVLNSAGVNSSRSVSIPEGQNEAFIDLNAAGNARVGDWKIAVRGEAPLNGGTLHVSSPFATVKVAEPYVKLTFKQAAVELGGETELVVDVETLKPFEGDAPIALVGLPTKVATEPLTMNKETKELAFKVKAEAEAAPGNTKNLFCQITITEHGEPIVHTLGTGSLRVDKPLPPKKDAPAAVAGAKPAAAPTTAADGKRLTRLEQLRLEQKQRLESQSATPEKK